MAGSEIRRTCPSAMRESQMSKHEEKQQKLAAAAAAASSKQHARTHTHTQTHTHTRTHTHAHAHMESLTQHWKNTLPTGGDSKPHTATFLSSSEARSLELHHHHQQLQR